MKNILLFTFFLLLTISTLAQGAQPTVTLSSAVRQANVVGAGINVEDASYLLKDNLLFDNQGFEQPTGAVYINCKTLSDNVCISDNQYAQWPTGFSNGWTFRPQLVGGGKSGTVISQIAASGNTGLTLTLSTAPGTTHIVLEGTFPSRNVSDISEWQGNGSGSVTLETTDVADGQQAVIVDGTGGAENFLRYFDNSDGIHSGTQLNGNYELDFMAKPGTATNVTVDIVRYVGSTTEVFLHKVQALTQGWQHYSIPFTGSENGTQIGNGRVLIEVSGGTVMLDDISMPLVEPANATPFRSVALSAMKELHPGSLRYMNGAGFAVKIDDAILPINVRRPALPATTKLQAQLPSVDYYQALQLAQTLGSHAWITLPQTITPLEMQHLVEWLAGASTTPYGAKRAARGQTLPWTSVFDKIYLELGNEDWNGITDSNNAGDPQTYGKHANDIFIAAHTSGSWSANITLVADGWNTNGADADAALYWEQNVRSQLTVPFMMSEAPYFYTTFNNGSSTEAIYGPLYAETQLFDNPTSGLETTIYKDLRASGNDMGVYEENLGTNSGTATQSQFDALTGTVGSSLAVADQMLGLIGLGVKTQNLFTLFGLHNQTSSGATTNLWGAVIDIGGATNIKRPIFLAEQMVNSAAMSTMLTTVQADDPTYNSAASSNDSLQAVPNVKSLRSYAFTNGSKTSLVLVNMSRTATVSPSLIGFPVIAPESITQLTSGKITDDNETSQLITQKDITTTWKGATPELPPFSMTVYIWDAPPAGIALSSTVLPATLTFVSTVGVTSAPQLVTVKNTGSTAITLGTVSFTGTNASSFLKSASTCGTSLAAAAICTISVEFKPVSAGSLTASLSIANNAIGSPQLVPMRGTSTAVSVLPATLTFVSTVGVTSAPQLVTVKNTGSTAITLGTVSFTGTNASSFLKSASTCGTSLAAAAICTISVEFKPVSAGSLTASLSIANNAIGSPQLVPMRGTASAALTDLRLLVPILQFQIPPMYVLAQDSHCFRERMGRDIIC